MNLLRWFSIHEPAKLSCSVNLVKILWGARYSSAPLTIRVNDSRLRLFQTDLIGLKYEEPLKKRRSILSLWVRSHVCAQTCKEKLSKTSRIRPPGFCSLISLETRTDPFFLLIRWKLEDALTNECIKPDRWCIDFHQCWVIVGSLTV